MGNDSSYQTSSPEFVEHASKAAPTINEQALSKLQEGAGLQDKVGDKPGAGAIGRGAEDAGKIGKGAEDAGKIGKGVEDAGAIGKGAEDAGKSLSELVKSLGEHSPPSDKERADAEKTLEGRMSKLIPEADRNAMKAMTTALTNGDAKGFSEALKKAGGDPEKLKALVNEVDKMLEEKGSGTRLDVTADGHVLVSDAGRGVGLSFDPKTGAVEAKSVEANMDGSVLVKPGELLHVKTDETFKGMGDKAVNAVNGKLDFGIEKPDPFAPVRIPEFPRDPENPHFPKWPDGHDPVIKEPFWPKDPGFDITPGHPRIIDPGFDITPGHPRIIDPGFDITPGHPRFIDPGFDITPRNPRELDPGFGINRPEPKYPEFRPDYKGEDPDWSILKRLDEGRSIGTTGKSGSDLTDSKKKVEQQ